MIRSQQETPGFKQIIKAAAINREYRVYSLNPWLREVHWTRCDGLYQAVMLATQAYTEGWSVVVFEDGDEWEGEPVLVFGFERGSSFFMKVRDLILKGKFDWESFPTNPITRKMEKWNETATRT